MNKRTFRKLKHFLEGFTNAFTPIEDGFLKDGGYYIKTISNKRRGLITYEEDRSRQESPRDKESIPTPRDSEPISARKRRREAISA